jgi:nucleotide-binding universal stress UspA family protein
MVRVLVAVDESEASVRAAEVAYRLFGDAEYLAINVADPGVDPARTPWWGAGWGVGPPYTYGMVWPYHVGAPADAALAPESDRSPDRRPIDEAEDDARSVADRTGLPDAEPIGAVGQPADAILDAAEQHGVDVVVVGARQRGWFDRLFDPSVSGDVVKRAEVPVLVVK